MNHKERKTMRLFLLAIALLAALPAFADNFSSEFGSQVGTDMVGQSIYPKTKLAYGVNGVATDVSASNPLPTSSTAAGKAAITTVRNDYSSTAVTTGAWVQLIASLSANVTTLYIFDSSGQTLELGVGGAGSEVRQIIIPPGGNGLIPLAVAASSRVSIRAISATANVGELDINLLQ